MFLSRPRQSRASLPLFHPDELNSAARYQNECAIRALCMNVYLGDNTALSRVLGRYKMFVDTQDVGLSSHLMLDGYWEMWLTEVIARTVKPGMRVADVGANLGYFSVLMAELVGNGGAFHAFEPNPALARRLRKTIAANGFEQRSTIHEMAAGDQDGAAFRLIIPENEPKNGYIVPVEPDTPDGPDIVRTRRLDSFPELLDIDVIKIDADTAERAIWRGMRGIFDRGRPMTVFLEFNVVRYEDPAAFLQEVLAEGFRISIVDLAEGKLPIDTETILAQPGVEDQMLMMER